MVKRVPGSNKMASGISAFSNANAAPAGTSSGTSSSTGAQKQKTVGITVILSTIFAAVLHKYSVTPTEYKSLFLDVLTDVICNRYAPARVRYYITLYYAW